MHVGAVVRSIAGRDRYRLYVICGISEDGCALIADGCLHKKASPKKKNLRHLKVLAAKGIAKTSLEELDDAGICTALRDYEMNK